MKLTKMRTLVAAGTIGLVGIAGVAAATTAGAQTTDPIVQATKTKGAFMKSLTPEQKDCLQANGVTKPDRPMTKAERRAAIENLGAAATTCGVTLPDRLANAITRAGKVDGAKTSLKALTPEQKDCLKSNGVAKPDHKLTKDERAAWVAQLKTAADTCGIALG